MTDIRVGTFSLEDLSEDDLTIIQSDVQWAKATGEPRKWTVLIDAEGKPSIARVWEVGR